MPFVQVIEYESDQRDELRELSERWARERPDDGPSRLVMAEDRDRPGHFVMVAEFDTYEQAMAHSGRPETGAYAERMRKLAKGAPRYVNLEVAHQET
ncbi:hypothetical protein [Micromonospora sp. DT47]|uniref:hypothetical protein n=1 Tax=Micromonospora sp. DT47 TaxID=3393431 RepID=UPI003CFA6CB1